MESARTFSNVVYVAAPETASIFYLSDVVGRRASFVWYSFQVKATACPVVKYEVYLDRGSDGILVPGLSYVNPFNEFAESGKRNVNKFEINVMDNTKPLIYKFEIKATVHGDFK